MAPEFRLTPPETTSVALARATDDIFGAYLAGWKASVNKGKIPVLDNKRQRLVATRLKDFAVEDLVGAARGIFLSPWNLEHGETSFDLALRDAAHIEKFSAIAVEPPSDGTADDDDAAIARAHAARNAQGPRPPRRPLVAGIGLPPERTPPGAATPEATMAVLAGCADSKRHLRTDLPPLPHAPLKLPNPPPPPVTAISGPNYSFIATPQGVFEVMSPDGAAK